MRKKAVKLIAIVIILACLMPALFACNKDLALNKKYYYHVYSSQTNKFEKIEVTINFDKNNRFTDTFTLITDQGQKKLVLTGSFNYDKDAKVAYVTYDKSAYTIRDEFYKNLTPEQKQSLNEELDKLYKASAMDGEIFVDGRIIFRGSSIKAARTGTSSENLGQIEGVYTVSPPQGAAPGQDLTFKLNAGKVYLRDKEKPDVYDIERGYYSVSNNYISITTFDENNTSQKTTKYLLSRIKLPIYKGVEFAKNLEDQANLKQNNSLEVIVLATDFYVKQR